jgi:hypothetical protein
MGGHGHDRIYRKYDGAKLAEIRYCNFCKCTRMFVVAKERWEYDGSAGMPYVYSPEMIARCTKCGHEPGYNGSTTRKAT